MPRKKKIPAEIREQVAEIVERFNQEFVKNPEHYFVTRYRASYLYLDRKDSITYQRGRLEYNGDMDNWDFAIFKYSSESYDPDEWMFPGSEHLNGTVEGGLKACLEAYP